MKKKKPKISPSKLPQAKSSPKKSSPTKSSPALTNQTIPVPDCKDLPPTASTVASDAQLDLPVGVDAQPQLDIQVLESDKSISTAQELVIAATVADPTLACVEDGTKVEESSSNKALCSSSATEASGVNCSEENTELEMSISLVAAEATTVVLCSQVPENVIPKGQSPLLQNAAGQRSPAQESATAPTVEVDKATLVGSQKIAVSTAEEATKKQTPVTKTPANDWCAHAKGYGKRLSKKGESFTLPSGEACIKIPNSVIEKNRKAWDSFVLGQFYSDPPSQGTLHNIVNGIWSKHYRDISVSKMEGFAFLFRIPNAATRARVVKQCLWQIEGQTMFVDKWEPGVVPTKPELTSAPIWLELRQVPFQFFNEDGLERIAGLVGDPRFLHPTTANKTNLEVAKVFTIIDPRKPLPEAVNVQFDSGEISRVLVSSPWMPPVCESCKEIGHVTRKCPAAAKACALCKATDHTQATCPQKQSKEKAKRKTRRSKSRGKQVWKAVENVDDPSLATSSPASANGEAQNKDITPTSEVQHTEIVINPKLGSGGPTERGETSNTPEYLRLTRQRSGSAASKSSKSDLPSDSSDVESTDSELEEGEVNLQDDGFEVVSNKKKFGGLKHSGQKGNRGRSPKQHF